MEDQSFELDERDSNPVKLVSWLAERDLPTPGVLPREVRDATGIGCKVLQLDETKAALVCFKLATGEVVHLVTLDRAQLDEILPTIQEAPDRCHGCEVSGWASAAWGDGGKAMILLGKMDAKRLKEAF